MEINKIIKVEVVGFQPYGIFIECVDEKEYSGLIHISEISDEFVRDVTKICNIGDKLYAKVLDVDSKTKHVKLSLKATKGRVRYKQAFYKPSHKKEYDDFSVLDNNLDNWIKSELERK